MIPAQRKVGAAHPPVLAPMAPGAPGVTSAGYELSCTWMTGLASVGIHRVVRVDDNTIAMSGELDKKCVVAVKDLRGETISVITLGNEQVRGLCVLDLHRTTVVVITKRHQVELWDPLARKLLHRLPLPHLDPCAICLSSWDTVLVASWSQAHADVDRKLPKTDILELQATPAKVRQLDHKLEINLTCVFSMVKAHKILAMTSFNNDIVLAVDYLTGDFLWKVENREYEGVIIRPNGICSDDAGYIYVADTALPYCRVFVLSPYGQIVKKILNTAGWCDDICWISHPDRKLVVLHDKTGLDKQDVSMYTLDPLPPPKPPGMDTV